MIIQIRGTSGSGKTTLVKRIMGLYESKVRVMVPGRKQPLGYILPHPDGGRSLFLVGHYETACGGCDTIPSYDRNIEIVREAHAAGYDVLFEGLLISGETRRCIELHTDGLPYSCYALDTPLDVCVASINDRRRQKNPDKPDVNPVNTENKYKTVQSAMRKLEAAGVPVAWGERTLLLHQIARILGVGI